MAKSVKKAAAAPKSAAKPRTPSRKKHRHPCKRKWKREFDLPRTNRACLPIGSSPSADACMGNHEARLVPRRAGASRPGLPDRRSSRLRQRNALPGAIASCWKSTCKSALLQIRHQAFQRRLGRARERLGQRGQRLVDHVQLIDERRLLRIDIEHAGEDLFLFMRLHQRAHRVGLVRRIVILKQLAQPAVASRRAFPRRTLRPNRNPLRCRRSWPQIRSR